MASGSSRPKGAAERAPMPRSLLDIVEIRRLDAAATSPSSASSSSSSTPAADGQDDEEELLYITAGLPWSFGYGTRAFGGTILAVGVQAAYTSLVHKMGPEQADAYTLYSFQGSFLSPTKLTQPLRLRVTAIRDARSFVTRVVQGFQLDEAGTERNTFVATADFVRRGQRTVQGGLFSIPPVDPSTGRAWERPDHLPSVMEINARRRTEYDEGVRNGTLAPHPTTDRAIFLESLLWTPISNLQEVRPLPTSPVHESITAFDMERPTTQDHLAMTEKTAADYLRWTEDPHQLLQQQSQRAPATGCTLASLNVCSLSLSLDYYLAGIALFLAKIPRSAALFVSLDFSLRYHVADIDLTQWHLREVKAVSAGQGRTYSEAAVWREGQLVATISQQCYCKPTAKVGGVATISQSNPAYGAAPPPPKEAHADGASQQDDEQGPRKSRL